MIRCRPPVVALLEAAARGSADGVAWFGAEPELRAAIALVWPGAVIHAAAASEAWDALLVDAGAAAQVLIWRGIHDRGRDLRVRIAMAEAGFAGFAVYLRPTVLPPGFWALDPHADAAQPVGPPPTLDDLALGRVDAETRRVAELPFRAPALDWARRAHLQALARGAGGAHRWPGAPGAEETGALLERCYEEALRGRLERMDARAIEALLAAWELDLPDGFAGVKRALVADAFEDDAAGRARGPRPRPRRSPRGGWRSATCTRCDASRSVSSPGSWWTRRTDARSRPTSPSPSTTRPPA